MAHSDLDLSYHKGMLVYYVYRHVSVFRLKNLPIITITIIILKNHDINMHYVLRIYIADGSSGFKAQAGRYHLYVSLACPWAHRTLIVRKLKGLEDVISVNVVDWLLNFEKGWEFNEQVIENF